MGSNSKNELNPKTQTPKPLSFDAVEFAAQLTKFFEIQNRQTQKPKENDD